MAIRTSTAQWQGTLQEGSGTLALGSKSFEGAYSFVSRFQDGPGTNPEELIGAAHAACYSMFLSNVLSKAGFPPNSVDTSAAVHLESRPDGPTISKVELTTRGVVPGLTDEQFVEYAQQAKVGCPVSKALGAIDVTLDAALA